MRALRKCAVVWGMTAALLGWFIPLGHGDTDPAPLILNDDGGWSWFEDERAIVVNGTLFVGSVAMGR